MSPQDKAAEALRLAESLECDVNSGRVRFGSARWAIEMAREYAALLQAQPEASCMVERGETVDLTLIADPVRRAAFEAYHNTHSGHYDRLCAAIEAATKAQPAEAERIQRLEVENEALRGAIHDEMDEGLRLRELGGAREDENITAMTERVIRERDALKRVAGTARAVADDSEDLGEDFLVPSHLMAPLSLALDELDAMTKEQKT